LTGSVRLPETPPLRAQRFANIIFSSGIVFLREINGCERSCQHLSRAAAILRLSGNIEFEAMR
jgi:hypothetical protein